MKTYDLIIIGGGMAGLTAAVYAAQARVDTLVLEKNICGGLANWAVEIQNFPSYETISGEALLEKTKAQVERLGVEIKEIEEVLRVDFQADVKTIVTDDDTYAARAVIVATGREPIKLPLEADEDHVHYCAICDGALYRDKHVLVVGGGNSGVGDALYLLTQGVGEITLVEMMDCLLAARKDQEQLLQHGNVKVMTCTQVADIEVQEDMQCVTLKNVNTGESECIDVCGIFVYIGQKPETDVFKGVLDMTDVGYILTDEEMATSVAGVFAAGDVRHKKIRQLTTAAADGTIAALSVNDYIRALSEN
ncbi:MAG: FAD-dependent oxidoreductase [Thermodesulfobacteriota bacterium]